MENGLCNKYNSERLCLLEENFFGKDKDKYYKRMKFKKLVLEVYRICKKDEIIGIIYDVNLTCSLCKIADINAFLKDNDPAMLHLISRSTGENIDIYEWELEDFKIEEYTRIITIGEIGGKKRYFFY